MVQLSVVVGRLKRHGVDADFIAAPSNGSDIARLNLVDQGHNADLIVAGAYGRWAADP